MQYDKKCLLNESRMKNIHGAGRGVVFLRGDFLKAGEHARRGLTSLFFLGGALHRVPQLLKRKPLPYALKAIKQELRRFFSADPSNNRGAQRGIAAGFPGFETGATVFRLRVYAGSSRSLSLFFESVLLFSWLYRTISLVKVSIFLSVFILCILALLPSAANAGLIVQRPLYIGHRN